MNRENRNNIYTQLRTEHPDFYYHSFNYIYKNNEFIVDFHFSIGTKYHFRPQHIISRPDILEWTDASKESLDSLVFHLGMIELISYWKASCSPKVIIKPFLLNKEQIQWWKNLYFEGLGEFFYLNEIETSITDFMNIQSPTEKIFQPIENDLNNDLVMIPIGGGKDSVVSLELIKTIGKKIIPMVVNPRGATIDSIENASFSVNNSLICKRTIDPQLLELNKKGFLNGHTPFSAMLAFLSLLSSHLLGIQYIALSNESSANESTVEGSTVNHQYSKSYKFESDFRYYYKKYLNAKTEYFSFLRPLSEIQIACIFSQFPKHHYSFRSCNVGSKENIWCGECPKCLFTYVLFSPFIAQSKMQQIFGKKLLNDQKLSHTLEELRGKTISKPFECVGTVSEVELALKNAQTDYSSEILMKNILKDTDNQQLKNALLEWNEENELPVIFEVLLKEQLRKC